MKRRALLCVVSVAVVIVVSWLGACAGTKTYDASDTKHNVVIRKSMILIPGTEISKADHAEMNKILNKYDKALYRVATYENGQLKTTKGKLSDLLMDRSLASQIARNVKKTGFSMDAMQIGVPLLKPDSLSSAFQNVSTASEATPTPTPVSDREPEAEGTAPTPLKSQNIYRSIQLVSELAPILKEYSQ